MAALVAWDNTKSITENFCFLISIVVARQQGAFVPRTIAESKSLYSQVWANVNSFDFTALDAIINGNGAVITPQQTPGQVGTANASDLGTAVTLVNALKTAHNTLITLLDTSGVITG